VPLPPRRRPNRRRWPTVLMVGLVDARPDQRAGSFVHSATQPRSESMKRPWTAEPRFAFITVGDVGGCPSRCSSTGGHLASTPPPPLGTSFMVGAPGPQVPDLQGWTVGRAQAVAFQDLLACG